jgi:HEAT repeat protein
MNASASETSEIDQRIRVLLFPSGDRQFRGAREQALAYLLEHAEEAHPRLLALAEGDSPPVTVLAALPRFGRVESVPVLEKALRHASDATTVVAGQALGQHPRPEARAALERALGDPRNQVVASAAEGLALRGERASCPALEAALAHPDPDVRARISAAMGRIGCRER